MSPAEVYKILNTTGILDNYIIKCYDWNEIGTSLEFTMKFFYYIMIVSKNIQTAKNT